MRLSVLRSGARVVVVGAVVTASALLGASSALADQTTDCQPGQVVIDGQCSVPAPQTGSQPSDNHSSNDNGHH